MKDKEFRAACSRITVSVGESVRMVRAFSAMTHSELARLIWDSAIHYLRY